MQLQTYNPFTVTPSDNGLVTLHVDMDPQHVNIFVSMLSSLHEYFKAINHRAKCASVFHRLPQFREDCMKRSIEISEKVNGLFSFIQSKNPEMTPAQVVKETNRQISKLYANVGFNEVRRILTKSGKLRESGYYKNFHKNKKNTCN